MAYIRDLWHDEIRDGFLVTTGRKKIWERSLELLAQFANICARHGWHWWLAYGALLGAARHGGFIPWDDDIDVFMTRPEYNAFCELAPAELAAPFFLQTGYNDRLLIAFAKLRHEQTAAIEFPDWPDYHQGIFIDIFPLDAMPDPVAGADSAAGEVGTAAASGTVAAGSAGAAATAEAQQLTFTLEKELWLLTVQRDEFLQACATGRYTPAMPQAELQAVAALPKRQRLRVFEDMATAAWGSTRTVNHLVDFLTNGGRGNIPRACLQATVELPFETVRVPAFREYGAFLTSQYGDWRTPQQLPNDHAGALMSADISYRDCLQQLDRTQLTGGAAL